MGTLKSLLWPWIWPTYQLARRFTDRGIYRSRYLRRPDALECPTATAPGEIADDAVLIDRIIAAYQRAACKTATGDSMWRTFFSDYHAEIHDALCNGPRWRVEQILRNPRCSNLLFGFDNLCKILGTRLEDKLAPKQTLDALIAFAEALGVRRLDNPEAYGLRAPPRTDPDELLAAIDRALGVRLPVPNPYPGHHGVRTARGVLTYRVPQAMYQAWRIRELTRHIENPRVLEIGAGLGRTALYAHVMGIRDYTLVDIPISGVAQGYFLGRVLKCVALSGEPKSAVTLRTPEEFFASDERYDLIVNVDSLTEMDRSVAERYVTAIKSRAEAFLSINHEANGFTVRELLSGSRNPYWLRRGYVEEITIMSNAPRR